MAWRVEFEDAALKELAKLDKPVARRILAFLRERVAVLDDPRSVGEALKGSRLGDFWKYRVGDYMSLPISRTGRCASWCWRWATGERFTVSGDRQLCLEK